MLSIFAHKSTDDLKTEAEISRILTASVDNKIKKNDYDYQ